MPKQKAVADKKYYEKNRTKILEKKREKRQKQKKEKVFEIIENNDSDGDQIYLAQVVRKREDTFWVIKNTAIIISRLSNNIEEITQTELQYRKTRPIRVIPKTAITVTDDYRRAVEIIGEDDLLHRLSKYRVIHGTKNVVDQYYIGVTEIIEEDEMLKRREQNRVASGTADIVGKYHRGPTEIISNDTLIKRKGVLVPTKEPTLFGKGCVITDTLSQSPKMQLDVHSFYYNTPSPFLFAPNHPNSASFTQRPNAKQTVASTEEKSLIPIKF